MSSTDSSEIVVEYRNLDHIGYPGYRAGSDGSVWSLWRTCPKGRFMSTIWRQMKISRQKTRNSGRAYCYLNLTDPHGKVTTYKLHRLILLAFVGPRPAGMQCRHKDRNPANNALSNICWDTPAANREDNRIGDRYQRGSEHPASELTEEKVRQIRAKYAQKFLQRELAEEFGVSVPTISLVVNRKIWRHVV